MPIDNLDNVPEPPWSDALGHLRNELSYQEQVGSTNAAAALRYSLTEIERLKAENDKFRTAVKEALGISGLTVLASKVVELHALINGQLEGK